MSHNLEEINGREISALTIRSAKDKSRVLSPTELRITKLGGVGGGNHKGIKLKVRRALDDFGPGPVEIKGEDLYALREFLAELPEEAFVRPADPVEKPERWAANDIIEEVRPGTDLAWIWVRDASGIWKHIGGGSSATDAQMDYFLGGSGTRGYDIYTVVRQASGQDL